MRVAAGRAIGAGALAAALWTLTSVVPWSPTEGIVRAVVPGLLQSLLATSVALMAVVVAAGALLIGAIVAGAALLVRGRARFPVVWLAVAVGGLLASVAMVVGQLIGIASRFGPVFPLADAPQLLGLPVWGLLVGWAPALVAGWAPGGMGRGIPGTIVAIASPLLALALAAATSVAAPLPVSNPAAPAARPSPQPSQPDEPPPSSTGTVAYAYQLASTDCPGDALVLDATGGGAATGHREYDVQIRNTSDAACTIMGYPGVALTGARERITAATVRPGSSFMVQDPGPAPVTLAPDVTAIASIGWDAGAEPNDPTTSTGMILAIADTSPTLASPADALDIVDGTVVTVTAWHAGALDAGPG